MNKILYHIYLFFFSSHIFATVCLDMQALPVLGNYYPQVLKNLLKYYLTTFKDPLMSKQPPFLQSFIIAEAIFQLPFFFVFLYALIKKKNWIRIPSILYGSHTATTVWALLYEFGLSKDIDNTTRITLISLYYPYFLIPLILAIHMSMTEIPFPDKNKKEK